MIELIEKGGPVMYPLLGCSFIALTFIVERGLFWWDMHRRKNTKEIEHFLELLRRSQIKEMLRLGKQSKNPILQVLVGSLSHGEKVIHDGLELEVEKKIEATQKKLSILDTIVTISPLLGIFGTVTGIIQTFQVLGQGNITDPQAVSYGIAQALITTATGLAIAMPTIIFHNLFLSQSNRFAYTLEKYAAEFEILYEQHLNKKIEVA